MTAAPGVAMLRSGVLACRAFFSAIRVLTMPKPGHSNDLFGRDGWAHRTFGDW